MPACSCSKKNCPSKGEILKICSGPCAAFKRRKFWEKIYEKKERENFSSSVIIFSKMDDCENFGVILLLRWDCKRKYHDYFAFWRKTTKYIVTINLVVGWNVFLPFYKSLYTKPVWGNFWSSLTPIIQNFSCTLLHQFTARNPKKSWGCLSFVSNRELLG